MARRSSKRTLNDYPRRPIRGSHYSIEVKSQPIEVNLDPAELAKPVAEAIRREVARGIHEIRELSADRTHRFANVTGKLRSGLRLVLKDEEWSVLVPRDRLNPREWPRDQLQKFRERLFELVPALRRPLTVPGVEKAIGESLRKSIRVKRR